MTCVGATVKGCNNGNINSADWGVTIGYLNPANIVVGVTAAKGLIVLHGGSNGTTPESFALTDAYFRAGYEVVQIVWADDWQLLFDPMPMNMLGNIQYAACRPATIFNWIFANLFPSVQSANKNAAMCALGTSAGSAAIAYSLAYYNASTYLDNVELLSGPVLSDIQQGCGVGPGLGANTSINVCGLQNCGSGSNKYQCGCQLGTGTTWTLGPEYLPGAIAGVATWTNDSTCANTWPTYTSAASNAQWLAESVVDLAPGGSSGAAPVFSYPNTGMTAWLCRSVQNPNNYNCAANNNANPNACPNNSSSQGQIYYANFGSGNLPPNYAIYAVDSCANAEGVAGGTVTGFYPNYFGPPNYIQGVLAITYDMVGDGNIVPAQCVKRHF